MVVIHVRNSEAEAFLFEAKTSMVTDELIQDLVNIWNVRIRLLQLVGGIRELAKYGPMKHPDESGLDHLKEKFNEIRIEKSEFYQMDPMGVRTGNGPGPQLTETIERIACDVESILDKNYVTRKIPLTSAQLQEKLDLIRGVVTMAYPMGLPEHDTIRQTIEGEHGIDGTAAGQSLLDATTAELWGPGSRLIQRGQTVGEQFGRNEKALYKVVLQKSGSGPPGRPPAVSAEEQSAMMAYAFKKQEEMKRLTESTEDDYLASSWANPKQLQKSLRGQGDIIAPGI